MKHYTDTKYIEWLMFDRDYGDRSALRAESLAQVKRGYRRRERAALKQQLIEELTSWDDIEPERRYWHGKQMEHADEYERLYYEQLWIVETGEEPSELVRAAMDAENRLYSAACAELRAA